MDGDLAFPCLPLPRGQNWERNTDLDAAVKQLGINQGRQSMA